MADARYSDAFCPHCGGSGSEPSALVAAIAQRERDYRAALDVLADPPSEAAVEGAERELREAIELVRCLRRLVPACAVEDLHRAFGAPGDFGYETPIGAALARVYGLQS